MAEETSRLRVICCRLFLVQAVTLILFVLLAVYVSFQEDRLRIVQRELRNQDWMVNEHSLLISDTKEMLLKNTQQQKTIDNILGLVEIEVNNLFKKTELLYVAAGKTWTQLNEIHSESQSKERVIQHFKDDLDKIQYGINYMEKTIQEVKDRMTEISNRSDSVIGNQQNFQAQLGIISGAIQNYAQRLSQTGSDKKQISGKRTKGNNSSSSSLDATTKTLESRIQSQDGIINEHSKAIKAAKESIQNIQSNIEGIQQRVTSGSGESCQTGVADMDQATSNGGDTLLHVQFGSPFTSHPVISYGIVKFDVSTGSNRAAVGVTLQDQSASGFTVNFNAWTASPINDCTVSWMACARS